MFASEIIVYKNFLDIYYKNYIYDNHIITIIINYLIDLLEKDFVIYNDYNWEKISKYIYLSEHFINRYNNQLNWEHICQYQQLSEHMMEKYIYKIDWFLISLYQKLSEQFMSKYKENICWINISMYQKISKKFVKKYKKYIHELCLIHNKHYQNWKI